MLRELDGRGIASRVQGRAALERAIRRLMIRCHRYGRARATSAADTQWAAIVIDRLGAALMEAPPVDRVQGRV